MNKFTGKLKKMAAVANSHIDPHYHIGMRVVKTAVAVMICLLIALLIGGWDSVTIAAVSAIVTIRTTRGDTVHSGVFRILGTVIGGITGVLTVIIGLFLPYYSDGLFVIVIPLMLLVDLYLCNVLKMPDSCTISCVVTILVASNIKLDATVGGALIFTLYRLRDTLIGVGVATVLNVAPHYIAMRINPEKGVEDDQSESKPI